jgi:hypothetical protein
MRRLFVLAALLSTSALAGDANATRFFFGAGGQFAWGIGGLSAADSRHSSLPLMRHQARAVAMRRVIDVMPGETNVV